MTGPKGQYEERGILPRSLTHTFQKLQDNSELKELTTLRVCYLEIYNEALYDLLDFKADPGEIQIAEDAKGVIHLKGAKMPIVKNEAEALSLIFEVISCVYFLRASC